MEGLIDDHDLRGKQRFCFGYVEFELPVICSLEDVSAIQNVNLKLMGEFATRLSRWYLKLKQWIKSAQEFMWIEKKAEEEKLPA